MPTTVLKFRRQLEYNTLRERLFERVNAVLRAHGLLLDKGTVVDDTIIAAPSSTKNQEKARDPDMHQTRKDNQWYFGMKAHIGADLHSGAVHSLTCTAANVADITATANLLHGREATVCADAGYIGADKREALQERDGRWHIAEKRGKLATMDDGPVKYLAKQAKRLQAQIRARVEHPFHVVKNLFGRRKARYRGLKKNTTHLHILFALANLYLLRRPLMA
jgi:IS5 family transposase